MMLTNNDWERLRILRDRFLRDASENYWTTERDLELYDTIYAERIGWKWNAALNTLTQLGWKSQSDKIIDWGCGTGIASRSVAAWSGIQEVELFDQSTLSLHFSKKRLTAEGLTVSIRPEEKPFSEKSLLLISHVLGELKEEEFLKLAAKATTANEVIWVEPGSRDISRRLSRVRNIFCDAGHHVIAPCTHQEPCPMLTPERERDWCHFFAPPPTEIFQSSFWHETSRQLGIDLRSLPYSYIVFSRHEHRVAPSEAERLIGHPREFKGYGKLFCCGSSGICERTLQKRDHPLLFKKLIKHQEAGVFTWSLDKAGRIINAEQHS